MLCYKMTTFPALLKPSNGEGMCTRPFSNIYSSSSLSRGLLSLLLSLELASQRYYVCEDGPFIFSKA